MTSVEYLFDYLEKINIKIPCEVEYKIKSLHQDEVCKAYVYGSAYGIDVQNNLKPEIYYNETFKNIEQ